MPCIVLLGWKIGEDAQSDGLGVLVIMVLFTVYSIIHMIGPVILKPLLRMLPERCVADRVDTLDWIWQPSMVKEQTFFDDIISTRRRV